MSKADIKHAEMIGQRYTELSSSGHQDVTFLMAEKSLQNVMGINYKGTAHEACRIADHAIQFVRTRRFKGDFTTKEEIDSLMKSAENNLRVVEEAKKRIRPQMFQVHEHVRSWIETHHPEHISTISDTAAYMWGKKRRPQLQQWYNAPIEMTTRLMTDWMIQVYTLAKDLGYESRQ